MLRERYLVTTAAPSTPPDAELRAILGDDVLRRV